MKHQIISPVADVHGVPDAKALRGKNETQLVYGETFMVGGESAGWCKGDCAHDGYPGHIEKKNLGPVTKQTHVVNAARSHVYLDASMKSPKAVTLSFGSRIMVTGARDGWAEIAGLGWIFEKHIGLIDQADKDYVGNARKFLDTPYYWGGRSGFGIDCSGLVQVVLARAGIPAPRDTEEQQNIIGKKIDKAETGDIVFFPGHVGIMTDERSIIHANAFHMKVTIEPLNIVADRSKGITGVRRL